MILSGLHQEVSEMPAADIIRREIVVRGSFAYAPSNFARAVELLDQGVVDLDPWIVEAPLRDGGRWFDRLDRRSGRCIEGIVDAGVEWQSLNWVCRHAEGSLERKQLDQRKPILLK